MSPGMTDPSYGFSEEVKEFVRQDDCLMTIWLLWQVYSSPNHPLAREALDVALEHVDTHWPACPLKVRQIAEVDPDPSKKRAYFWVMNRFMVSLMRADGQYRVIEGPDGWTCYWVVSPHMKTPYRATEAFQPRTDDRPGYCIFDVDEALFQNPHPLIQWLDVTAASEVKDFPPEAGALHTRSLFSHERFQLFVRCEGQIRRLAPGWTLHDRYHGVTRKHLEDQAGLREAVTKASCEPLSVADEITALERIALEYRAGESWFIGFLDHTLPHRLMDEWDKESKYPLTLAGPLDMPTQDDSTSIEESVEVTKRSVEGWKTAEEERISQLDQPRILKRVWSQLDEVERQVALRRADKWTDSEIAQELGYTRETVTRMRSYIKKKATALLSSSGWKASPRAKRRRRLKSHGARNS